MNRHINIAQIEISTGDIEGNTQKIIDTINNSSAEFDVFPELAITGYNCGNLFQSDVFIKDAENALDKIINSIQHNKVVILGSIFKNGSKLYNSSFVITGNKIIEMTHKIHLANDNHHQDRKFFTPGTQLKVIDIKGLRFATIICEDAWNTSRDLYEELRNENVDLVFSLNSSYNTFTKIETRKKVFLDKECFIPTVYVNNIGMGDFIKAFVSYDGSSMIIDKNKNFVVLPRYEEVNFEVLFDTQTHEFSGTEYNSLYEVQKDEQYGLPNNVYSCDIRDILHSGVDVNFNRLVYIDKYKKYKNILDMAIYATRSVFKINGIKKAQVHCSGGLDSSLIAYLAVKALGKENCVFITQPSKNNGDETKGNAVYESEKLGVELIWDPIEDYMELFKSKNPDASKIHIATVEATIRGSLGLGACHKNGTALLSATNHTENAIGWSTYLDISYAGIISLLGDLDKLECLYLAEFINIIEDDEIIPAKLYDGRMTPSAELEDSSEDPWDYEIMSPICSEIVRNNNYDKDDVYDKVLNILLRNNYSSGRVGDIIVDETTGDEQIIDNVSEALVFVKKDILEYIDAAYKLIPRSAYKRFQSPAYLYMSDGGSFGTASRETLINKWRK